MLYERVAIGNRRDHRSSFFLKSSSIKPPYGTPAAKQVRQNVVAGGELGKAAAEREELGVRPRLDDASPIGNTIWSASRTVEPVRDRDRRSAFGQPLERLLHEPLSLRV